jgi:hypothetical protein
MLISLSNKFVFIANPKTASTAIEKVLRPYSDVALVESRFGKHQSFLEIEARFAWLLSLVDPSEWFVFSVMRDPIDFMISLYNSHMDPKFEERTELYTGATDFEDFINAWTTTHDDQSRQQHVRLLDGNNRIAANYIIRYDNLKEGLRYVGERIEVDGLVPLGIENESYGDFNRVMLTAAQHDHIEKSFALDRQVLDRYCDHLLTFRPGLAFGDPETEAERAEAMSVLHCTRSVQSAEVFDDLTINGIGTTGVTRLDDPSFIRSLYLGILNREPDPDGFMFYVNQLAQGCLTREDITISFSGSPEAQSRAGLPESLREGIKPNDIRVNRGHIRAMNIHFLQTAELTYRPLLELTSQTVTEYCAKHGFSYEYYFGIIRGYRPWHAAYNRIPLLKRLLDSGYTGWACYLDADAYVADLDFDLREYLADKGHVSFIAATDRLLDPDRPYWLVNSGVFLVNLGNPVGQAIVREWSEQFNAITDQRLQDATEWDQITNDQDMLQRILRDLPGAEASTLTLGGEPNLINYSHGVYIRQVLRGGMTLGGRIDKLRSETNRVLGLSRQQPTSEDPLPLELIRALYRTLLLREPDPDGLGRQSELIRNGTPIEDIIRGFLKSPEFHQNREFIESYITTDSLWPRG